MRRKKTWPCKLMMFFLTFALAVPLGPISALAAAKINHTPPAENYIPGFRINLDVEIQNSEDLLAARCYFKTKQDKNFAFTDLFDQGDGKYKAVLPAPWVNSEAVEYLFVTVDPEKKVTRSDLFVIEEGETEEATAWKDAGDVEQVRLDKAQEAAENYEVVSQQLKANHGNRLPDYQSVQSTDTLTVQTELSKEAVPLNGFYDKAVVTEVADSSKYGFMAKGLYTAEQAAAAEAAGISVASGGMSTLTKVGIGVLAVGAAGGAIAAADSGSSSSHSSSAAEELTPQTILGTWNLSGQNTVGSTATGTFTFNSNGRFTADTTEKIGDNDAADYYYEGDWSLDGTELTLAYDLGAEYIGQASGDSKNFSMTATNQSYPWTLNFSR
jgi:hypothetical protein